MTSRLIIRVDPATLSGSSLTLRLPRAYESLAADRVGEVVVFGQSEIPGVWSAYAVARFADWIFQGEDLLLQFIDLRHLAESVAVVTEGDKESDRLFAPYLVDTLLADDLTLFPDLQPEFVQGSQTPSSVVTERQEPLAGEVVGGLHLQRQDAAFFHRVATAYAWRCAFSHIGQSSIDGLAQEGVVVGLEEPFTRADGAERDGLFLSSSFAFAYRYGLLAIGDDYELLRHRQLEAEMRMFLEIANPKALVNLPASLVHWPDLEAARRHRHRFGY